MPDIPTLPPIVDARYNTVLVVDDEETVRSTAVRILERFGYRVLTAENEDEAVAIFTGNQNTLCAVLLDVVLASQNGREIAAVLGAINPKVPVILSSGFPKDIELEGLLNDNIVHFLPKPYSPANLLEAIAAALKFRLG